MKILDGRELAGFVKERQAHLVNMKRGSGKIPKLLILRDNDNPVINKYVTLKKNYGADIGVIVEDFVAKNSDELKNKILVANEDGTVSGIIVQLPLEDNGTDDILKLINPKKDVDGLSGNGSFDSATATAINWLLSGYGIELENKKIAIVGRGKLVGGPLERMWKNSGLDVTVFHRGDDLNKLSTFDVIVSATGAPRVISESFVKPGAVVVDAGTASENGVLVGDVDDSLRERDDISAITPKIGGVGPLTICALFENVINAD